MVDIENKESEYKNEIWIAIGSIIGIVLLWILSWVLIDCNIGKEQERGTFGDKFGAINSLFAGLAFAGIIFTILLQRKELQLQRDELSSTRAVFEKQNDMLSQEKFENTFFQMLSLFHSIVNSIDIRKLNGDKSVISGGRDCFKNYYNDVGNKAYNILWGEVPLIDPLTNRTYEPNKKPIQVYIDAYDLVYNKNRSDLSHYFRTLYHIIKLIDKSDLKDKQQYASIARAQLSSYEQIILFYNCLHGNGNKKFKPLIEKYALFKNLDRSLLGSQDHLEAYEKGAYENLKGERKLVYR